MLTRLILLRHGEAHAHAETGRDLDRELTEPGVEAAAAAGRALAEAGVRPDLVLVSHAVRARQTWEAARAAWPDPPPVREARGLYYQPPVKLIASAQAAGAAGVMLVAHNPGLQALVEAVAKGDPRLAKGFPPASAAVLSYDGGEAWTLQHLHLTERGAA